MTYMDDIPCSTLACEWSAWLSGITVAWDAWIARYAMRPKTSISNTVITKAPPQVQYSITRG